MSRPALNIVNTLTTFPHLDAYYLQEDNLKVQRGMNTLTITDLSDAMKTGKTCYSIYTRYSEEDSMFDAWQQLQLNGQFATNVRQFIESLKNQEQNGFTNSSLFELRDQVSRGVYSPFNLDVFKPLKELPTKWTLAHAKRALANGQYSKVVCNGRYTDDYAHDASVNYHEGAIPALSLLKRLVESPDGWWTYLRSVENGIAEVSVCCHQFDSNTVTIDLNARAATP